MSEQQFKYKVNKKEVPMSSHQAIQQAIFHYKAQVNDGREYAVEILDGLIKAQKQLERYERMVEVIMKRVEENEQLLKEIILR